MNNACLDRVVQSNPESTPLQALGELIALHDLRSCGGLHQESMEIHLPKGFFRFQVMQKMGNEVDGEDSIHVLLNHTGDVRFAMTIPIEEESRCRDLALVRRMGRPESEGEDLPEDVTLEGQIALSPNDARAFVLYLIQNFHGFQFHLVET